jgi:hypothetical protein
MEIRPIDKMAVQDQKKYIQELIHGAEKVLTDEGRAVQAAEVRRLFTTNAPDSDISMGLSQLLTNLALARVSDLKRVESNPNAPRLEVERCNDCYIKTGWNNSPCKFYDSGLEFSSQAASQLRSQDTPPAAPRAGEVEVAVAALHPDAPPAGPGYTRVLYPSFAPAPAPSKNLRLFIFPRRGTASRPTSFANPWPLLRPFLEVGVL